MGGRKKGKSTPGHEWFRIVLDEGETRSIIPVLVHRQLSNETNPCVAHIIRRQQTTFNHAVSNLKSRSRWCLTGTPIQNKIDDIGALFAFIKVRPFDSTTTFRRYVSGPFNDSEERQPTAIRNLTLLMDSMCLRRSRNLLHLPDPMDRTRVVKFSQVEQEQYEKTKRIMKRALQERVNEKNKSGVFGMFQILLQLRILCNHGTYQHSFSWTKRNLMNEREAVLCSFGNHGEVKCSVCKQCIPISMQSLFEKWPEKCAHVLCHECLDDNEQFMGARGLEAAGCPLCAMSSLPNNGCGINGNMDTRAENYLRDTGISSKITALVQDIQEGLWENKRLVFVNTTVTSELTLLLYYSIVFSCWTNTLDLIEKYLAFAQITFQRIDGDVNLSRRQKILDEFSSVDSKTPVLIMTTGTGAFG